jgi:hypothetical protein
VNELATIRPASNVEAYRASTDAAELCKAIVVATSSTIQKRRYVSVEGWQAIARAHGCAAGARDVEQVEGGVRAIGEVRDIISGQLIATAEGFVGEDEPVWYGGGTDKWGKPYVKRPAYAIRAMAQTRAMSRACRSAFAHVVVMMNANLQTTPAEEVPFDGFGTPPHDPQTGEIIEGELQRDPAIPGITKIRNNINKLRRDGAKATDLEAFNALVHGCKDDLQKIKDADHSLWSGMGEDFDGMKAWIKRRREELTPRQETAGFQLLCSLVQEAKSYEDLTGIIDEHDETLAKLDGDERRRFDESYNAREIEIIEKPTPLTTGAFGG